MANIRLFERSHPSAVDRATRLARVTQPGQSGYPQGAAAAGAKPRPPP